MKRFSTLECWTKRTHDSDLEAIEDPRDPKPNYHEKVEAAPRQSIEPERDIGVNDGRRRGRFLHSDASQPWTPEVFAFAEGCTRGVTQPSLSSSQLWTCGDQKRLTTRSGPFESSKNCVILERKMRALRAREVPKWSGRTSAAAEIARKRLRGKIGWH